jgi:diketogulonate reductase-like aldo/keto reductase
VLGLGTAAFGRRLTRRQKLRLLEHALDLGITYFDTAPLYGRGGAEGVVGAFAAPRRDRIGLATKLGLEWRGGRLRRQVVRAFEPDGARRRLEESLRKLRTDHVDVLLLHEPTQGDVGDDLLAFLAEAVGQGLARAVGVAGGPLLGPLAARPPVTPWVAQASVTVLESLPPGAFVVCHSAIVSARSGKARRAPAEALRRALAANPRGIVLFSTTDHDHLRANAAVPSD